MPSARPIDLDIPSGHDEKRGENARLRFSQAVPRRKKGCIFLLGEVTGLAIVPVMAAHQDGIAGGRGDGGRCSTPALFPEACVRPRLDRRPGIPERPILVLISGSSPN